MITPTDQQQDAGFEQLLQKAWIGDTINDRILARGIFKAGVKWALEEARKENYCEWCRFTIGNCQCKKLR